MKRINITKTFLPPVEEYTRYLNKIWKSGQLTNQGPLLRTFEDKLRSYLKVANLHFVTNGTIALQIGLKALDVTEGEVITTPFSYVATTSSVLWERCTPVFVDIDPNTFCIDPSQIEAAITKRTKAIMAVHIFGYPCDIESIDHIAKKHKLKVIYDGAHAFGVKYKNKSLLSYGDISTCSFHSTKLFHTIEGGCIITNDKKVSDKIELMKRFGHHGDEHHNLGINAKASEFQAAMGLCNLKYIQDIIKKIKRLADIYDERLSGIVQRPKLSMDTEYNYAYYPVLFENEGRLLEAMDRLAKENVFPRRYFYPSLNTLPYLQTTQSCPVSEDTSTRILCLPLYADLDEKSVNRICELVRS